MHHIFRYERAYTFLLHRAIINQISCFLFDSRILQPHPILNIKTHFQYASRLLSVMITDLSSRTVRSSRLLSSLRSCIVRQSLYSHDMEERSIVAFSKYGKTFHSLCALFKKKKETYFVRATAASRHFQNPDFQNRKYIFEKKHSGKKCSTFFTFKYFFIYFAYMCGTNTLSSIFTIIHYI